MNKLTEGIAKLMNISKEKSDTLTVLLVITLILLSPWILPILLYSLVNEPPYFTEIHVFGSLLLGSIAGGIIGGQLLKQRTKLVIIISFAFHTLGLPLMFSIGILISTRTSDIINLIISSFNEIVIVFVRIEVLMISILIMQCLGLYLARNPSLNQKLKSTEE